MGQFRPGVVAIDWADELVGAGTKELSGAGVAELVGGEEAGGRRPVSQSGSGLLLLSNKADAHFSSSSFEIVKCRGFELLLELKRAFRRFLNMCSGSMIK